jgi:hypothetical protein
LTDAESLHSEKVRTESWWLVSKVEPRPKVVQHSLKCLRSKIHLLNMMTAELSPIHTLQMVISLLCDQLVLLPTTYAMYTQAGRPLFFGSGCTTAGLTVGRMGDDDTSGRSPSLEDLTFSSDMMAMVLVVIV